MNSLLTHLTESVSRMFWGWHQRSFHKDRRRKTGRDADKQEAGEPREENGQLAGECNEFSRLWSWRCSETTMKSFQRCGTHRGSEARSKPEESVHHPLGGAWAHWLTGFCLLLGRVPHRHKSLGIPQGSALGPLLGGGCCLIRLHILKPSCGALWAFPSRAQLSFHVNDLPSSLILEL